MAPPTKMEPIILIIAIPIDDKYEHSLKFMFMASNNKAEYEALLVEI